MIAEKIESEATYDKCIQPWINGGDLLCLDIYVFGQPNYQYYERYREGLQKGEAYSTALLIITTQNSSHGVKLPLDVFL